jgi:hypothetical protein
MATRSSARKQSVTNGAGREVAINKARGLAFARRGEAEEWQPIDPEGVADLATRKGEGHAKIGDHWFSVYKVETGKQ